MKKILMLITAFFLFTTSPALANHAEGVAHDLVLKVDGMVCDFCAQSIKKVFGKQDSVNAVAVDLDEGEIIIDLKDGQTLDEETIRKLVLDSGYTVTKIRQGNKGE